MNGLNQVKQAVMTALEETGLQTKSRFSADSARRSTAPTAVVGVKQARGKAAAMGHYLGLERTASGKERELYGRSLEVTVSVDVYTAAGGDGCEEAMEQAAQALLEGLPSGLRLQSISWGETEWDGKSRLWLRRGTAEYLAQFLASADAESGEFLDFRLKGVLQQC